MDLGEIPGYKTCFLSEREENKDTLGTFSVSEVSWLADVETEVQRDSITLPRSHG